MTKRPTAVLLLGAALIASLSLASPAQARPAVIEAPAGAAACLAATKAASDAAIADRLIVINGHRATVTAASTLTASDRSVLLALYASDTSGLSSLKATIDGDAVCATAKADARLIVTNFRVYDLLGPQTHLTIATDAGKAAVSDLTGLEPVLKLAITQAKAAGKDVTAAEAAFSDLPAELSVASTALQTGTTAVLALTPAGYPANQTSLQATRTGVKAAAVALSKAAQDTATILALASPS